MSVRLTKAGYAKYSGDAKLICPLRRISTGPPLTTHSLMYCENGINPKLYNLNFHQLQVVSRYRDTQLEAGGITHVLCANEEQTVVHFEV